MHKNSPTVLLAPEKALPESLARIVAPVSLDLTRAGEAVLGVRVGPVQPASEFLDIEGVRLRVAQGQGRQPLPGQAALVERLRTFPPGRLLTYVILEATARQAKCYVDTEGEQLLSVLWLPAGGRGVEE